MLISFIKVLVITGIIVTSNVTAQEENQLTLEDIFVSNKYVPAKLANIRWLPDGGAFTYTLMNTKHKLFDIHKYEVESGTSTLLLSGIDLKWKNKSINNQLLFNMLIATYCHNANY